MRGLLAIASLSVGCLQPPADEEAGLHFEETGCFLDESGTPAMRCPQGSVEVVLDPAEAPIPPEPVAPVEIGTGIPGCSVECLLEDCPACAAIGSEETIDPGPAPETEPQGVMVLRDPAGREIERFALGEAPTSPEALAILETAVAAAGEYANRELVAAPLALTTLPPEAPAAAGARIAMPACQGLTVRGNVSKDGAATTFDGTVVVAPGSVEALPPGERRLLETVSYLGGVLVEKMRSWQCSGQNGSTPVVLAQASSMPGGGAILAALMSVAPQLVQPVIRAAQGLPPRLLPVVNIQPLAATTVRLSTRVLDAATKLERLRSFKVEGYVRVAPGAARELVLGEMTYIRELFRGPYMREVFLGRETASGLEGWSLLGIQDKLKIFTDVVRRGDLDETWLAITHHTGRLLGMARLLPATASSPEVYEYADETGRIIGRY